MIKVKIFCFALILDLLHRLPLIESYMTRFTLTALELPVGV